MEVSATPACEFQLGRLGGLARDGEEMETTIMSHDQRDWGLGFRVRRT